ncbi:hypothetical protein COD78_29500 [Bacillus cereus]|uniref:Transmembrane protein n=1 Tax=Bacillus cereus TaxID=1396 RepID=A0A9X6ZDC7_BACCE|nr:hypothetical protein [Bacillus cereus]OTW80959.1 hypothetical protein BK713_17635 [Bacillus thuringiensis serovar jinghongiensis]OTX18785.1 hypothetical protein BK715_09330 [Bacillus thuringiensis serovar japonensis]PDZ20749.1 hypothetical protein CON41_22060 [Bacillus cereus]PDZ79534.1 hypothetical protein CON31_11660 [Bacillus cereus]
MIRILFLYQKSQIKKDKIGEHDLIFSTRSKQKDNHHIFIIIYFLLILNIITILNKYIYIEKFITKLVINDSNLQSKLLAESLLLN